MGFIYDIQWQLARKALLCQPALSYRTHPRPIPQRPPSITTNSPPHTPNPVLILALDCWFRKNYAPGCFRYVFGLSFPSRTTYDFINLELPINTTAHIWQIVKQSSRKRRIPAGTYNQRKYPSRWFTVLAKWISLARVSFWFYHSPYKTIFVKCQHLFASLESCANRRT